MHVAMKINGGLAKVQINTHTHTRTHNSPKLYLPARCERISRTNSLIYENERAFVDSRAERLRRGELMGAKLAGDAHVRRMNIGDK